MFISSDVPLVTANDFRSPRERLQDEFSSTLIPWGISGFPEPGKVSGLARLDLAVKALEGALKALGKRDAATRVWLQGDLDRLLAARAAFLSVGEGFTGKAALELIEIYEAVSAEVQNARVALDRAPANREAIIGLQADLGLAEARSRDATRAAQAVLESCKFPKLPDVDMFARVASEVQQINTLAGRQPVHALERALAMAVRVVSGQMSSREVRILPCYAGDMNSTHWAAFAAYCAEGGVPIPAAA